MSKQDGGFENFVGDVLYAWRRQFRGVRISDVRSRGGIDGGRDYEIEVSANCHHLVQFLGRTLTPGGIYFVEAKSIGTAGGNGRVRLDYHRGSPNLSKSLGACAGFFFLTNAFSPPTDQVSYQNICKLSPELQFFDVIDGELLSNLARSFDVPLPNGVSFLGPQADPRASNHNGIVTIPYLSKFRDPSGEILKVVVSVFNRTNEQLNGELFFVNDEEWAGIELEGVSTPDVFPNPTLWAFHHQIGREVILDPYSSAAFIWYLKPVNRTIIVGRETSKHYQSVRSALRLRARDQIFNVLDKFERFDLTFLPPFVGATHKKTVDDIAKWADSALSERGIADDPKIILLFGETGVGKSRIIDETTNKSISGTGASVLRFTIPEKGGSLRRVQLRAIKDDLKAVTGEPIQGETLVEVLFNLVHSRFYIKHNTIFIVIEDFHNADDELLNLFSEQNSRDECNCKNLRFILSARDDGTYHNRGYDQFLATALQIQSTNWIKCCRVTRLAESEALDLIRLIFDDISDGGIEKIHRLSEGVPIRTIQTIEHLLDASIVEITSRGSVSIVNMEAFRRKAESLPRNVEDLFLKRVSNLLRVDDSHAAVKTLLIFSIFGNAVPKDVLDTDEDMRSSLELLVEWGFLRENQHHEVVEWKHETIEIFFATMLERWIVSPSRAPEFCRHYPDAADCVLDSEAFRSHIDCQTEAKILTVAERDEPAREGWHELYQHAASISSFQTVSTKAGWYECIDFAVRSALQDPGFDQETISKLLLLKVFIGTYFRSYASAEAAVQSGLSWLEHGPFETRLQDRTAEWMNQLSAHALLDAGHSASALSDLLRMNTKMQLHDYLREDLDFTYNVHNCLRMAFNYLNFFDLGVLHSQMANQTCMQLNQDHVLGSSFGDEAMLYYFVEPERSRNMLQRSIDVLTRCENQQHLIHSQVSLIGAELPGRYRARDREWIAAQESWVSEELTKVLARGYSSITPRLYLLLAALQFYLAVDDCDAEAVNSAVNPIMLEQADRNARRGIDACERHSIGYIAWQLHNLRAAISHRMGNQGRSLRSMDRAIKQIEEEGLFLLGHGPLCSAVPIILASAVNVFSNYASGQKVQKTLAKVHGFSIIHWSEPEMRQRCVEEARTFGTLFTDETNRVPDNAPFVRDTSSGIGIVTWF